jgi:membrane protease YdiL (CAAX protease family)
MQPAGQTINFRKEFIIYLFPPVIIIAGYLVFNFFADIWGDKQGYIAGMIFYWLFCCAVPVILWVSKGNRGLLLKINKPSWWQVILLIIPVILTILYSSFRTGVQESTFPLILLSLVFASVNAFSEELLWRGLYYDHHQGNFFHAVVVPSIWFGIWQYVPLSIHPAGIGNFYFILAAIVMGLCWGIVSFYTRSVFWSVISHLLVSLLSGFIIINN